MNAESPAGSREKRKPITVQSEFQQSVVLTPTAELGELLDLTALINHHTSQSFHYSFTALLLAFAYGRDRISAWFKDYMLNSGVDTAAILSSGNIPGGEEGMQHLSRQTIDSNSLYSGGLRMATASSFEWIEQAKRFSDQQKHSWVGLRHLMGALIFNLQFHERELTQWRFRRRHWASEYLQFVEKTLPDDLQFWKTVHAQVFPPEAVPPHSHAPAESSASASKSNVDNPASPKSEFEPVGNGYTRGTAGYTSEFCGLGGSQPVVDHLGMEDNARRLAELIALRETKLPLAVGLFGNWGSGKSHFMNLIDRHVKALSDEEKLQAADAPSKWCREIVPIYFNAWHYLDANLWASLVSQILESLFVYLRPKPGDLMKVQHLLEQASGATARVAEEVALAHTATERARAELSVAEKTSTERQTELAGLFDGLSKLLPQVKPEELRRLFGVEKEVTTLADFGALIRESQSLHQRVRALWKSAWKQPGRGWRLSWLVTTLVVVPALTAFALRYIPMIKDRLHGIGQAMVSLIASMSALAMWVRPIITEAGRRLRKMEDWQKQAEAEQRRLLETPEVKNANLKVSEAITKEQKAKIRLAETEAREKQLEEEARNFAPERRLSRFIEARAQSGDYRGQLGIVSLARKDFQELSDLFADTEALKAKVTALQKSNPTKARELEELSKSLDRIVLFVDDLDRCQPEKVVDVLQAVHLLLAFPLFAVVVGVDQRCLRQSLSLQFKGLLTPHSVSPNGKPRSKGNNDAEDQENRPVTPLDYLEKIFHVPFHLPAMGDAGFRTLIEKLTEPLKPLSPRTGTGPGSQSTPLTKINEAAQKILPGGGPIGEQDSGDPQKSPETLVPLSPARPPTSRPSVIGSVPLQDWERKALEAYHPLIGTPRGAKRLLNTYRLVRAGIPESEWNVFKGDGNTRGEFRVVMLLLAASAGYPAVAREWFDLMRTGDDFPALHNLWPARSDHAWLKFRSLYDQTFVIKTPNLNRDLCLKWLDRIELFTF
jgi:hypothetical protein